jgi:soluble lytic murein transglycosylase-like protein
MDINLIHLVALYSSIYNIDPHLAESVIQVESKGNPHAIGELNEQGLFQLLPQSFSSYSVKQLKDPSTNIYLGIRYLYEMKKYCKHKIDNSFVICFNKGIKGGSRIKHPMNDKYFLKVKETMK